jgi:hypothetical protein
VISYRVMDFRLYVFRIRMLKIVYHVMQLKVIQDCKGPANSRGLESLLVSAEVFIVHNRFIV